MPPDPPPPAEPEATRLAGQVVALAREVESLRRAVDRQRDHGDQAAQQVADHGRRLDDLTRQAEALAGAVASLAEQLADLDHDEHEDETARASWFDVDDPDTAAEILDDLAGWLRRVYLRYPDSALPECWAWHPHVVEELLWLGRAWREAYTGATASVLRQGDWADRQRPGVAARIKQATSACLLLLHTPGRDQDKLPRRVPILSALPTLAQWWATSPGSAPPSPTTDQLAEAEGMRK